jgi:hypothetical protein
MIWYDGDDAERERHAWDVQWTSNTGGRSLVCVPIDENEEPVPEDRFDADDLAASLEIEIPVSNRAEL